MEPSKLKFKNIYSSTPTKTFYTNVKSDATALTKLKCNQFFAAVPAGNNGNISIFYLPQGNDVTTTKIEASVPLTLSHNKQIQDFEFSPISPTILASTTRLDTLIRIWKLPEEFSPNTAPLGKEIDAANMYLAGHEKKVELVKFHPTVGNILTSTSSDATIRIWEIESMQDRISLITPNSASTTSISYDYCGDAMVTGASDGFINLFDPRVNSQPVQSTQTTHIPARNLKVCWLSPDPLIISTGFKEKGEREVILWDARSLSTPVDTLPVQGNGVGILQPIWDPALPLLYCFAKGEGIRCFELMEGKLSFVNMLKIERQATAIDLLPKSVCVASRCEIARFLRLGTDNSLETTSIYVPRVNCEKVFQSDLYPPVAYIDPEATSDRWFDKKESIEPIMIEIIKDLEPVQLPLTPNSELAQLLNSPVKKPALMATLTLNNRSNTIVRRARSLSKLLDDAAPARVSQVGLTDSRDTIAVEKIATTPVAVYLDGFLDIERRGWFGSTWEKHYFSLKRTKLYISADQDSDTALNCIPISTIRKIDRFNIGREISPNSNKIGFSIELDSGMIMRFRASTFLDCENWMKQLRLARERSAGGSLLNILPSKTTGLPRSDSINRVNEMSRENGLARSESKLMVGNREGAALIGHAMTRGTTQKQNPQQIWHPNFIVLDEEGLVHIYSSDIKDYVQGRPPLESINLSSAISVRLTDTSIDQTASSGCLNIFQINTSKRVVFFKFKTAYEAANWILEIRKVVRAKGLLQTFELISSDVLEGYVETFTEKNSKNTAMNGPMNSKKYFFSVIDGSFYYFTSFLDLVPEIVIGASKFEKVRDVSNSDNSQQFSIDPKDKRFCFDVVFTSEIGVIRHSVNSVAEKDRYIKELLKIRMQSFDLLGKMGINSDAKLLDELHGIKANLAKENNEKIDGIHVVDEKKVEKGENPPLLICVEGKVQIRIYYVELSYKSLRNDCAFVLDLGHTLYHWPGPKSSRVGRAKAMDVATRIRKTRGNRPRVFLVEESEPNYMQIFFKTLDAPSSQFPIDSEQQDPTNSVSTDIKIYKMNESPIRKKKVALCYEGTAPSKQILETSGVYVIQSMPTEVFVWIGKNSDTNSRLLSNLVSRNLALDMISNAVKESEENHRLIFTQRVYEDQETAVFREKFIDYEGSLPINMRVVETKGNIVTGLKQPKINVKELHDPRASMDADLDKIYSDIPTKGKVSMYLVKDFEKTPVEKLVYGHFFQNESYIILFVYKPLESGVDRCISYFWQGSSSSVTQKGTSALITIELSKETSGEVVQTRVVEGKEPKHLCMLFGERNVITRLPVDTVNQKYQVFEIREQYKDVCKAVELIIEEIPFHNSSVLLIIDQSKIHLWNGNFSTQGERKYAKTLATSMFKEKICEEIKEDDDLTKVLATMLDAEFSLKGSKRTQKRVTPKLFSCSSGSGVVKIEQIPFFTQEDLDPNIAMILDVEEEIYVWFGPNAKVNEKVISMESSLEYIKESKKHNLSTPLFVTFAYQEPIQFTTHFHGWTRRKFPKAFQNQPSKFRPLNDVLAEYKTEIFTVDKLLGDKLPEHVDPSKLEMYLSEEDFEKIFKIKKQEYLQMLPWKREKLKKEVGFF